MTQDQISQATFYLNKVLKIMSKDNKPVIKKRESARQRQDRIQAKINQKLAK